MIWIAIALSGLAIVLTLIPFAIRLSQDELSSISLRTSVNELMKQRDLVIAQFLKDEGAAAAGDLTPRAWERRQHFLASRFIDITRVLDRTDRSKELLRP